MKKPPFQDEFIDSNTGSVTVRFSRRELADLSRAISLALGVMLEERERGIMFSPDERFLPRVQALQQRITKLLITNGWLDDVDIVEGGVVTIEGRRCEVHYDDNVYYVLLRGTNVALSRNENRERAIEIATEALRLGANNITPSRPR
jgi:hypothetical protein